MSPDPLTVKLLVESSKKSVSYGTTYIQFPATSTADSRRRPDILALSDQLRFSEEPADQVLARQLVDILLERDPDDVSALTRLALLQQTAGHIDQAVQTQKRILQIDPGNTVAINNLSWTLAVEKNELSEALEWANKGLQAVSAPGDGEVADLLDTRGVIYYRLGRHAEALADLEQALSLYPLQHMARAGIHLHLAQVQLVLGNVAQARRFLVQASELHRRHHTLSPGDVHLLENLLHQQNLNEHLPL